MGNGTQFYHGPEQGWLRPPGGLRKNPISGVLLSARAEAKNLSSIQVQSTERFFGEKHASE